MTISCFQPLKQHSFLFTQQFFHYHSYLRVLENTIMFEVIFTICYVILTIMQNCKLAPESYNTLPGRHFEVV